jgi:hypothetical protein
LRNLYHADLPQTFLYRAASTSCPTQGLTDGGALGDRRWSGVGGDRGDRPPPWTEAATASTAATVEIAPQWTAAASAIGVEPLRLPLLFGRVGRGSGDAKESSDACSDDALEQKPCSSVACRDLDAIGGPPSAQFDLKLIGVGG